MLRVINTKMKGAQNRSRHWSKKKISFEPRTHQASGGTLGGLGGGGKENPGQTPDMGEAGWAVCGVNP